MIMCQELSDEEIARVCCEEMVSISPTDAQQFARALFKAAQVQQTQTRNNNDTPSQS